MNSCHALNGVDSEYQLRKRDSGQKFETKEIQSN